MPIFEYECGRCGAKFELLVRSSSEKIKCPECGSSKTEKLFSLFAGSCKSCETCSTSSGSG